MSEPSKGSQSVVLVTAMLSAVAALGVGFLTYKSNTEGTEVKRQEIALAQNRFDADERKRFEENIAKLVPLLFEKEQQKQDAALGTLFALYPDRAQEILLSTRVAFPGGKTNAIQDAVERAAALPQQAANWVIVTGSDRTVDEAQPEIAKAKKLGYSTTLYRKANWYKTTVGPFPSRSDAERANIAVRQTLRPDSYVVNVDTWCPSQKPQSGLIECTTK
jgi:hypothetical protein